MIRIQYTSESQILGTIVPTTNIIRKLLSLILEQQNNIQTQTAYWRTRFNCIPQAFTRLVNISIPLFIEIEDLLDCILYRNSHLVR